MEMGQTTRTIWRSDQYVVFYDKPLINFERLLETYPGFAPKGIQSFLAVRPVWLKEKHLLRNLPRKEVLAY